MQKYRIDKIAQLAPQLAFTPVDIRLEQLAAAEELLLSIDANKAYPFDFIIFRITGYHPKQGDSPLLTGLALQHDLGLLIEQVSENLQLVAESAPQQVLTIEEVTERFNVTSKTIQRWRRRGLAARRYTFPDGKRRVGFLVGTVESYLAIHRDQVLRAANFTQVTAGEKEEIFRRARRLAEKCHCCINEISRRIASRLNRSPLTVTSIIRAHDQQHPEAAIFPMASEEINEQDRSDILRAYRRGITIRALARRMCRARSAVYRVVLEERLARINRRKVKFIDDPLYHQPAAAEVMEQIANQDELAVDRKGEETRVPRDLPPYLKELYRTPLLTPARERALFLKLNFHKFQFVIARRKIEPQFARSRDLNQIEGYRRKIVETRNEIVRANLRLVVSVARKHLRPHLDLMELISEGNLTLMRAVESYDFHRGNRFSTYATFALMKGFARSVPQMQSRGSAAVQGGEALTFIADQSLPRLVDDVVHRDEVTHLLSQLDTRERDVILAHYGLAADQPATYEQVGSRMGLSKQRVRQIEQGAILKLRAGMGNAALRS